MQNKRFYWMLINIIVAIILSTVTAYAKLATYPPPLSPEQAFVLTLKKQNSSLWVAHWDIAKGYHLYKHTLHITAKTKGKFQLGSLNYPKGQVVQNKILGNYEIYNKSLDIQIPFVLEQNGTVDLNINYQGCFGDIYCFPPITKHFTLTTSTNPISSYTDTFAKNNIFILMLTFFGAGFLLAFTPCILPMLPILSSVIVGQKYPLSTMRIFLLTLVYVISMSVTYAIAGVFAGYIGETLQAYLQTPFVLIVFSLLFIFLAFSLFGFYEIQFPAFIRHRVHTMSSQQPSGNVLEAAIMGSLSMLIVSPCISAPLIGVLTYISSTGNTLLGGSVLFMMGMGMGTPLLIIGTVGGRYLPTSGPWMVKVKQFFGLIMLAMAIWITGRILPTTISLFLAGTLLIGSAILIFPLKTTATYLSKLIAALLIMSGVFVMAYPFIQQHQEPNDKAVLFKVVTTPTQLATQLALAKKIHKSVILDYYADWCVSCKEMDFTIFNNKQVKKLLINFILLRADVTSNSPNSRQLMKKYAVFAPPSIILFIDDNIHDKEFRITGTANLKQFIGFIQQSSIEKLQH